METRWSEASYPGTSAQPWPGDPDWSGGTLFTDVRERWVPASPDQVWPVLDSIGGQNGWYSVPLAWWARGVIDRAVGGVGLRRGRRNPDHLAVGDAVDFWRVEERIPGRLLRLRAEMRLPGLAWLEFSLQPVPDERGRGEPDSGGSRANPSPHRRGGTLLRQRALFHPRGLAGHAYWKGIAPFHAVVFGSMARNIAAAAERRPRAEGAAGPA